MKKIKPVKAWAGVDGGRIGSWEGVMGWGLYTPTMVAVFRSRKGAMDKFQHVVPVLITPIEPKKRRAKK